jgi:hypothetical protein
MPLTVFGQFSSAQLSSKKVASVHMAPLVSVGSSSSSRSNVRKGVVTNERPPMLLPPLEEGIYGAKVNILEVLLVQALTALQGWTVICYNPLSYPTCVTRKVRRRVNYSTTQTGRPPKAVFSHNNTTV